MKKIINIYKPAGVTPLQAVKKFKIENPKYNNKKIAYAGRLDPMAHGVLLLLIEPETKNRERYQKLDKKYEFTAVFGIRSDSFDILGIPELIQDRTILGRLKLDILTKSYIGIFNQKLPIFSSYRIKGKPLYYHARNGKIDTIKIPQKEVKIYSIRLIKVFAIDKSKMLDNIITRISLVKGDFRQKVIKESWRKLISQSKLSKFSAAKFVIHCQSGTYIRSLVEIMGKDLKTGALTYDIKRTAVGDYQLEDSTHLKW